MSYTWGSSSTDANITNATISSSSSLASAAISNSGQAVTEIGLTYTTASGATLGAKVEIWRTTDGGTTYQADADTPQQFSLPFTANATLHYVFSVPGTISQFKVNLINLDSTHSITAATMKLRQATN